jgi:hypothetical protein
MSIYGGFRSHKTFVAQSNGTLDTHGAYVMAEVTSAVDTNFYPNPFDANGDPVVSPPDPIPLKANVTRTIPMQLYNFKADAAVTVVAYRM